MFSNSFESCISDARQNTVVSVAVHAFLFFFLSENFSKFRVRSCKA